MATAQELRAKANNLLKKAQELESKSFLNIGKLVKGHFDNNFKKFEIEKFKEEISKILNN